MDRKQVLLVATFVILCQRHFFEFVAGSVETISDYAKVVNNVRKGTTEKTTESNITILPLNDTTQPFEEYEDFDEIQEDESRSVKGSSSSDAILKYFSGLISLLALVNNFKIGGNNIPQKSPLVRNKNAIKKSIITKRMDEAQETGKQFYDAQDRFEFPQKKFRKTMKDNEDIQFQPLENYPPYNPLTANKAESYGSDNTKTSYDVYNSQDANGGAMTQEQQPHPYDIPYETAKPIKQNNDGTTWDYHPVYQSWVSKPQHNDEPSNADSYHQWQEPDDTKAIGNGYDAKHPWDGNDYQISHHDYDHSHAPPDHHLHYDEIEHPVDEDRVSKKPYSYYFLGRKLWYVPLLFSVYFIIYIGALVLKSVARHKIQFPEKVWDLHDEAFGHAKHRKYRKIDEITENYENAVDKIKKKFM